MWERGFQDIPLELDLESDFYKIEETGNGVISVLEGYRTAPANNFTVQKIAEWHSSSGIIWELPEKYERRSNLSGMHLKIAVINTVRQ